MFGMLVGVAFTQHAEGNVNINLERKEAFKDFHNKKFAQAAQRFFTLARVSKTPEKEEYKYYLGITLLELKMYQVAAFQFIDVVRGKQSRYRKLSLQKLSIAADYLGDDTTLNYALTKINPDEVPKSEVSMVYYRLGEVKLINNSYNDAIRYFSKVNPGSSYYYMAMFNKGISEMYAKQLDSAIATFKKIIYSRIAKEVTDTTLVAAKIGLARAYYQKHDWSAAVKAYADIPRDSEYWHDVLFEQSWAYLRSGRFRSALSNFHSLHSPYYEENYIPESLLLRAIVYLYICKYDEMEKVLQLFEKTYNPLTTTLKRNARFSNLFVYGELSKYQSFDLNSGVFKSRIPNLIINYVLSQGDIKRSFSYLDKLNSETKLINTISGIRNTPFARYSLKLLNGRVKNTKSLIGEVAKVHMDVVKSELEELNEQANFVRYEMISGQKEELKQKLVGDGLENTIDKDYEREFYIENGYQYYPFQGEYWLDEIGNYHYLGKSSCRKL